MGQVWKYGAQVLWTASSSVSYYRVTITDQVDTTKTQTKTWRGGTAGVYFSQLRSGRLYKITVLPICGSTTGDPNSIYFTTR